MPKYNLSPEKLQILEAMWVEGVQSHRTETERLKVMEVAAATGLVVEQVKVWIYNRNRKKRKGIEGQTKRKPGGSLQAPAPSTEGLTSGDVGHTTSLASPEEAVSSGAGQEAPSSSSSSSSASSSSEGERSCSSVEQNQNQEQDQHQEIIQAVEDQVHKLHACNCEVVVMVYNHNSGSLYTTGTPKGLDFLNSQNPAVHWQFSSAVSNACTEFRS